MGGYVWQCAFLLNMQETKRWLRLCNFFVMGKWSDHFTELAGKD